MATPIVANLFIDNVEEVAINSFQFKREFWYGYTYI